MTPVEKYARDSPPEPVEKTNPGVLTLTLALVIDAISEEESIETLLGPLTRSTVVQLSAAEYTPRRDTVVDPVELRYLIVFPLIRHCPVTLLNVAIWQLVFLNASLTKEHSAAHSVGPATGMEKSVLLVSTARPHSTSYSYRDWSMIFVIRLPSSSGQKKGSEVTSAGAAPSAVADGTRTTAVGLPAVVELTLDAATDKESLARLLSTTGLEEVASVKLGVNVAFCVSETVVVTVYNRVLMNVDTSRS